MSEHRRREPPRSAANSTDERWREQRVNSSEVTVVVVSWEGGHLLDPCLNSLAEQTVRCRVLVVDNASTDSTADVLARRKPPVEVLSLDHNTGFAGGVAAALPIVHTPYVALLNNDAAADPSWLEHSLALLKARPDVAAVASRMLFWEGATINNAGVKLVAGGYGTDRGLGEPDAPPYDQPAEVFGFSGGATVLRGTAVRQVGGIPAEFFLYYEDTDLSWRLRLAGWRIWYEPHALVRHRHGASSDLSSDLFAFHTERNRLLMLLRCAPLGFALTQLVRFGITTLSLRARRMLGQNVGDSRVFGLALRLRVLRSVLGHMPAALRSRKRADGYGRVARRAVVRDWIPR